MGKSPSSCFPAGCCINSIFLRQHWSFYSSTVKECLSVCCCYNGLCFCRYFGQVPQCLSGAVYLFVVPTRVCHVSLGFIELLHSPVGSREAFEVLLMLGAPNAKEGNFLWSWPCCCWTAVLQVHACFGRCLQSPVLELLFLAVSQATVGSETGYQLCNVSRGRRVWRHCSHHGQHWMCCLFVCGMAC